MRALFLILSLCVLMLNVAVAQQDDEDRECTDDKENTIFYVNGVLNTRSQALNYGQSEGITKLREQQFSSRAAFAGIS